MAWRLVVNEKRRRMNVDRLWWYAYFLEKLRTSYCEEEEEEEGRGMLDERGLNDVCMYVMWHVGREGRRKKELEKQVGFAFCKVIFSSCF